MLFVGSVWEVKLAQIQLEHNYRYNYYRCLATSHPLFYDDEPLIKPYYALDFVGGYHLKSTQVL